MILPRTAHRPLLRHLTRLKAEHKRRIDGRRLLFYRPYPKQREFHAAGAARRERLFMAGNQLGKTLAGGFEAAIHATGLYPAWWTGHRFAGPTVGWAAGVTGETVRESVQRVLMGRHTDVGTGAIPQATIVDYTAARGVADLMDTIEVRHVSGGTSLITLKSYEKGREKWQAETLDWVWFDEEPHAKIYTEGVTRTNATKGLVWITFTPLKGMSDVVKRFLLEPSADRHVTTMTIDDAEHYSPEERARIIASYDAHEREARTKGIPVLGSGRVFPVVEEMLREPQPVIPKHWARICGLDIGWDHPTAAVWLAWDRDTDVIHVTDCYRVREQTPVVHAAALKARGPWIPVAWPHDGLQHDRGSGVPIAQQYRDHGANLLGEKASFPDGSNGVEAGILELLDRMKTGRFKVAAHLNDWWEEFRLYHRKDGQIVKEGDDLMAATRYALMMLRFAQTEPKPMAGLMDYRMPGVV
ncbi:MAG: terminase large subunit [Rhodospirillaceae bacterium]|nr:terminase large subunit [Rhodospirillaceae bacterium]